MGYGARRIAPGPLSGSGLRSRLPAAPRFAGIVVALVGVTVLGGWIFDLEHLTGLRAGLATMKANTALAFLLMGTALSLLAPPAPDRRARRLAQGCALASVVLAERRRAEAEADRASQTKSEFLANMSHELRTPLNGIIGFTELMHDAKVGAVSAEHKEYLGDILTSARHLLELINDILDLAKVESGKMEFRPEPIDVPGLVGEVRDILSTVAARKHIEVGIDIDRQIGTPVLDPGKLKQVFYNYLSNALKFTPDGGRVIIRVGKESDKELLVEVEDTGIGIRPEDMGRLFVAFQQLDASTVKKHAGTGLGLALTRRIVEAQGGRVGVRSTPGQGSVFFAVLPWRPRSD